MKVYCCSLLLCNTNPLPPILLPRNHSSDRIQSFWGVVAAPRAMSCLGLQALMNLCVSNIQKCSYTSTPRTRATNIALRLTSDTPIDRGDERLRSTAQHRWGSWKDGTSAKTRQTLSCLLLHKQGTQRNKDSDCEPQGCRERDLTSDMCSQGIK